MPPIAEAQVQDLWDRLLNVALWKGVRFHDAEELVSDAIMKGLEAFDEARGQLFPFCKTILLNLIKNHWRDRKPQTTLPEDIREESERNPLRLLVTEEENVRMHRILRRLSRELTTTELEFLHTLAEVMDELGERAISEAARRLGYEPLKGHDIFRRIQRKARKLFPEGPVTPAMVRSEVAPSAARLPGVKPSRPAMVREPGTDPLVFNIADVKRRTESFSRFFESLSDSHRAALAKFLS